MNEKELSIYATQEKILFERIKYCEKMCHRYYEISVELFKDGDKKEAKKYWYYTKEFYIEYTEVWGRWYSLLDLKYMLGIDYNKYYESIDRKKVEEEENMHKNISTNNIKKYFIHNMRKVILGGK